MILSVSRRTDIPAYYSEWFFNRIREGFLYVRNPMNSRQVSRIDLSPELVDCIVFWTKNPKPMLDRLGELRDYACYFQFTLTGYGKELEAGLPDKEKVMIPVFQELSSKIGREKVIWRYDPIVFSDKYSINYHLRTFEKYAALLNGYTEKCVISFVDIYARNKKNMAAFGLQEISPQELRAFARQIADMAHANGMVMAACSEAMDLEACGIEHNHCIDKELIERLTGYRIKAGKDKGQRAECGCIESVEVGTYDTCRSGCKYCYANHSPAAVEANCALYDPTSPLLCSEPLGSRDKVTDRKVTSLKGEPVNAPEQMSFLI
ncbi:MAG: DUF1848 domain-containing protein [Blautia sp.]|nr:DUF1848 domain-containing protein [Blautia sp.]